METMRAVVYYGRGDVRVERIPVPVCGDGELRVKVDACAVCGSDLKTYRAGNPRMKPPMTVGHEFSGIIDTVGRSVRGFAPGERIVMATSISCGQCFYCRRGWSNLCASLNPMGFSYPGGMAEYLIVPAGAVRNGHVVKVPAGIPAEHACLAEPASCAVNAVESCGVKPGDVVVVVGAGPMGILNVYAAREAGAKTVILAQREGRRLEAARRFDIDRLVNTDREDLVKIVREYNDGTGADCAIVAAPSPEPQAAAVDLVHRRGTVCLFASLPVGGHLLPLDSRKIHYGELRVIGASDSTAAHVARAVAMLGKPGFPAGRLASHLLPLAQVHEAFRMMEAREGMRIVLKPQAETAA